ncbi:MULTISPECIES: hypothetical protein [Acinetobacter]|uniref:hypothetical protein n=1 Tax=Acinetobacter TaxID=469 RepID=UPI00070EBBF7|nr:hypothetical protein [Acinetobacter pittii]KRI80585.1 hypothetical protein APC68_06540 [Acinetobacter pittii]KRJ67466.1 hypothetical protein APC92_02040 [Acinetobacter pittii]
MKKEIILALSCLLPFPVLADCNVGAMTLTGASNSGQWSSLVTLTGQKLTSYTQANNSLESQAATNSPTNLPASNIIAFEYRSALLHKDLKGKAPLIEPNLRRNLGKWST